ncbi:crossover junction endodeoxyribonuclease RuvC [Salinisphaera sp. PC39]|uniref:crossover junction endodeoxyribonuclease RuvC n=1 Tax=Salinisphaera sp. PC39 TaxID=1304156 RepID=UPI00333F8920
MSRILGIDPGSVITGYGVIETEGGASLCEAGCLRLPDAPFPERLARIFDGLRAVIREWSPEEMAVEDVFVSRNPASALKLGQARGAAICAGAAAGLPIAEYSPAKIKQAIVGRGAADKRQVQHMVRMLLNVREPLQADAADAVAVALCHLHHRQTATRMAARGVSS